MRIYFYSTFRTIRTTGIVNKVSGKIVFVTIKLKDGNTPEIRVNRVRILGERLEDDSCGDRKECMEKLDRFNEQKTEKSDNGTTTENKT